MNRVRRELSSLGPIGWSARNVGLATAPAFPWIGDAAVPAVALYSRGDLP